MAAFEPLWYTPRGENELDGLDGPGLRSGSNSPLAKRALLGRMRLETSLDRHNWQAGSLRISQLSTSETAGRARLRTQIWRDLGQVSWGFNCEEPCCEPFSRTESRQRAETLETGGIVIVIMQATFKIESEGFRRLLLSTQRFKKGHRSRVVRNFVVFNGPAPDGLLL